MLRLLLCLPAALVACATETTPAHERSPRWAQPVPGGGVAKWHKVDERLHRCAQPSATDMRTLEAHGVRSVVNLREYHSDVQKADGTELVVVEVPLDAGDMSYDDLVRALAALAAAPKPAAVHCWRGSDRTGAVVAAWRVAVDGWTPSQALDEMVAGGFGHSSWYGNLRTLIGGLDAERLRRDLDAALAPAR